MKTRSFYITGDDTIQSVQHKFSGLFPLLTIHFYCLDEKAPSDDSCVMLSSACRIADINPKIRDGYIPISGNTMVYEIEHAIHQRFGLYAEISDNSNAHRNLTGPISHRHLNMHYSGTTLQHGRDPALYFEKIPFGC